MEKSRKPKIRFKGFTDDWEQREFKELYSKSGEKNDGSIGINKNITVATMQFKDDVKVSTPEYLRTYYTFNLGDIAFEGHQSKDFRYGRFVENDIGNGIVSHIFSVFRPVQEYDLHFWKYAINNETLMQRILSRSTKASTMMHDLVTDDFLNETFLVPSLSEQEAIGSVLHKLDHLITLHQRKLDKLINVKKSMLEKMFPKQGSTVPEIRFSGFTQAWEQRKLSDEVSSIDTGKSEFDAKESGDYEILGSTGVIGYDDSFDYEGDFLLTARVGANAGTLYRHSGKVKITDNTVFLQGSHIDFVFYLLNKFDLKKMSFGSGQPLIKASELKYLELMMPVQNEEKEKIATYFLNLDSLITLHQRKIEKLKNIKKSMLEKMFI